jgi:hypothetical protein
MMAFMDRSWYSGRRSTGRDISEPGQATWSQRPSEIEPPKKQNARIVSDASAVRLC